LRRILLFVTLTLLLAACASSPSLASPTLSPSSAPAAIHIHRAYIATAAGIVPVDLATNTALATIPTPTGTLPVDIVITKKNLAYVAALSTKGSSASSSLLPLDLTTGAFATPIPLPTTTLPFSLYLSEDESTIYILTVYASGGVVVPFDVKSQTLLPAISTPKGTFPVALALAPGGKSGFLAVNASVVNAPNEVLPLDLRSDTFSSPLVSPQETYPSDVVLSPDGSTGYITDAVQTLPTQASVNACGCPGVSEVVPFDTATNTPQVKLGYWAGSDLSDNANTADSITITPDGKTAYVAERDPRGYGTVLIPVDLTTSPASIKLAHPDSAGGNTYNVATDGSINALVISADSATGYMLSGSYRDASGQTIGSTPGLLTPIDLATFMPTIPLLLTSTSFSLALTD
jgi:hypothetical protein